MTPAVTFCCYRGQGSRGYDGQARPHARGRARLTHIVGGSATLWLVIVTSVSGSDVSENGNSEIEIARKRNFADTDLRNITSFDEAFAAAADVYGGVVDASTVIGTGFDVLDRDDKAQLIGEPFVIIEMQFNPSAEFGGEFVSFAAVTEHNRRVIVNDGSTGICLQLRNWFDETGRNGGLLVKGGLRKSDYPANDVRPAGTTYYLNV